MFYHYDVWSTDETGYFQQLRKLVLLRCDPRRGIRYAGSASNGLRIDSHSGSFVAENHCGTAGRAVFRE
jgi:hypothetical protein